jgi:hypothetical protein
MDISMQPARVEPSPLARASSLHVAVAHAHADHARCHQDHVHVLGRLDEPERHVVARGEAQGVARAQAGCHVLAVDLGHHFVRDEQHHQVGAVTRVGNRQHLEAVRHRLLL